MPDQIFVAEVVFTTDKVNVTDVNEHSFVIHSKGITKLKYFEKMFYSSGNGSFKFARPPPFQMKGSRRFRTALPPTRGCGYIT